MEQLNTYLEGLLGGAKTGINSAATDWLMSYVQSGKVFKAHGEFDCTLDNDTINIDTKYTGIVNIALDNLNEFTNSNAYQKCGIKKIHFNTEVVSGYSNSLTFNKNTTLSSDNQIHVYTYYTARISGLNIEAQKVEIAGCTTLKDCNVNAHIIFLVDKSKTIQCNLKSDYIFICSSFEKTKIKLLSELGLVENNGATRLNFIKQDDSNKPLINIDPIKVLGLKKWVGDTIVITERWRNMDMSDCAIITKDKSMILNANNILEMKNGWWVGICEGLIKDYLNSL